jgi:hypothetical protein
MMFGRSVVVAAACRPATGARSETDNVKSGSFMGGKSEFGVDELTLIPG